MVAVALSLGCDGATVVGGGFGNGDGGATDRPSSTIDGAADVTGTHARPKASGEEGVEGSWTLVDNVAMRVLRTFGEVPADLICVRPALPTDLKTRIAEAFKAACAGEPKADVKAIFGADRFTDAPTSGYAALRASLTEANAAGLFD